jgi:hypothetical protein
MRTKTGAGQHEQTNKQEMATRDVAWYAALPHDDGVRGEFGSIVVLGGGGAKDSRSAARLKEQERF